jgi:hypothetical protein
MSLSLGMGRWEMMEQRSVLFDTNQRPSKIDWDPRKYRGKFIGNPPKYGVRRRIIYAFSSCITENTLSLSITNTDIYISLSLNYKYWHISLSLSLYIYIYTYTHTHTVGCAKTKTNECYNEQFLSVKSGCYNEQFLSIKSGWYNESGGILTADVARACAWRIGPSGFD